MFIREENDTDTTITGDQAGAAAGADGKTADAAANADSKTGDAGAGEGQGEAGKDDKQDGKDAGDGKADDGAKDEGQQPVVPEKYTVPEGMKVDQWRLDSYSELAKAAGFPQEQFDESIKQAEAMWAKHMETQRGEWRLQSEEQFGKNFEGITKGAERAIVELEKERPGITERLDATNLGNHPDVLWAFNKIGELLKPKKLDGIDTEGAGSQPRSIEDRLWGKK